MSCLLAVCLAIGVTANSYSDLEQSYSLNVKAGNDVYAWGSYEKQDTRILGQSLSAIDVASAGIGARYDRGSFVAFAEIGYSLIESNDVEFIRDEIVYTTMVHNHNVSPSRPIPSRDPSYNEGAHTSYDISNGMLGRIGVGYRVKGLTISMAYRIQYVDERIKMWDDDVVSTTGGWWQETNTRDLSAFEAGISWEF